MARRYPDQRLRLSLLRAMDAVEAQGSLLKASVTLGISQPALTKNLQELEDILQRRLFDRHSRGVIPTAASVSDGNGLRLFRLDAQSLAVLCCAHLSRARCGQCVLH